jgi:copper chaperone CopZ
MIKLFGRKKRTQIELVVRGMTCEHCEMRVAKALKAVPGVADASADREKEQALIDIEGSDDVSIEALVAAVEAAGYEAEAPAA